MEQLTRLLIKAPVIFGFLLATLIPPLKAQDGTISVITFVTQSVITALGGADQTVFKIQQEIQKLDTALKYSGIRPNVQLTAVIPWNNNLNMCKQTLLSNLMTFTDSNIKQIRETYKGDIVLIIVDDPQSCGISGNQIDKYAAYIIVDYRCLGANYSVARQFGYVLGAGNENSQSGWFPNDDENARAYTQLDDDGNEVFTTIMGYTDETISATLDDFIMVPFYSNLSYLYHGNPLGTASENNAASMLLNFDVVANYTNQTNSYIVFDLQAESGEYIDLYCDETLTFDDFVAAPGSSVIIEADHVEFNNGVVFTPGSKGRKRPRED